MFLRDKLKRERGEADSGKYMNPLLDAKQKAEKKQKYGIKNLIFLLKRNIKTAKEPLVSH